MKRFDPEAIDVHQPIGTVIVCVRDSDAANTYMAWFNEAEPLGQVYVLTIDPGGPDLGDDESRREWVNSHTTNSAFIRAYGFEEAATYILDMIDSYTEEYENDVSEG